MALVLLLSQNFLQTKVGIFDNMDLNLSRLVEAECHADNIVF